MLDMPDMPDLPRVTLVVTQRERMSLTERSLESILDDLSEPFRLIYVSAGAPDDVNTYLDRRQKEVGFTLIRHPEWMWPNTARNLACATIDTPYVVFIDNDVLVEPGWLKKLVACADETGAALVGPLYLWSDDKVEPRIHMAGGTMTMADTPAGKTLHERHDDINAPLSHRAHLKRAPCDFLEYHCMLVRIDFLHSIGGLSETIVCVHEHIDMALAAKKAGKTVWMEPTSAITYLAFVPYQLSDLAFYCWRWSPQAAEKSIRAFCKKWELADDAAAFSGVRNFVHKHVTAIDPFLPNAPTAKPTATMTAQDIKQHLYGLLTQAAAQGYDNAALESISTAYTAAMTLFAGGFRPCARSFIAHCTGTASALVAFGFAPHVVIAGMLHAAYSHTPLGPEPTATLENLANQLRTIFGKRVERLIAAYAHFQANPQAWCTAHPLKTLATDEAETVVIAIANSIDECAAGEPLFSNKPGPTSAWIAYARAVSTGLGVPALAETLAQLADIKAPEGFNIRRPVNESYRLANGNLVPMAHNLSAFFSWDGARNSTPSPS